MDIDKGSCHMKSQWEYKFKNFACTINHWDEKIFIKFIKPVLSVIDNHVNEEIRDIQPNIIIHFILFSPETHRRAFTSNLKSYYELKHTHLIVLPAKFFDLTLIERTSDLLHEMIHVFLGHTYAKSLKEIDMGKENVNV